MSATSVEKRATRVVAARKKRAGAVAITVVLGIAAIAWLSPLALLIITALRPLSDYIANGALTWPKQFTIGNFAQAWDVGNFAATYRNSFIITIVKVPLGVLFASLLAYAIAKLRLPGRNIVMFSVFLGLTVPIYIAILPNFVMLRQLGLTDSLAGLVGPYLAFGISFEVLVLQSFFRGIPDEIIEAARVDGASAARIFFQICLLYTSDAADE